MSVRLEMIKFIKHFHKEQVRKYTGNPYTDHLFEVAGIVSSVDSTDETFLVALGHDLIEDTECTYKDILDVFGLRVANGIQLLSDLEVGNREVRKRLSRERLSKTPKWIQNIKVSDLISNTSSIVKHDPKFAEVYLKEKLLTLDMLTEADVRLKEIAYQQIKDSQI